MSDILENHVDISQELYVIENEPRGKAVKDAIYDALVKLNNAKSAPAPSPTPLPGQIGEAEVIYRLTSFYDEAPGIGGVVRNIQFLPDNGWNFWQEADDNPKTTATVTATPAVSCLLVATVMHRDTVSIEVDGWTKVVDSQTTLGTNISQQITVWTKSVSAGTHSVTVTQSSEVRLSLKLIALYQASSLTLVDNTALASVPYTPAAKTGKRRLYLLSSVYASSASDPPNSVTTTYSGIDLKSANELRFSAFYDYNTESSAVPSFSYQDTSNYSANSMNALVFDIEEG